MYQEIRKCKINETEWDFSFFIIESWEVMKFQTLFCTIQISGKHDNVYMRINPKRFLTHQQQSETWNKRFSLSRNWQRPK